MVRVRLSGLPGDAEAMAALLTSCPGVDVLTGPDGPYPNRRQPGHRLYLTVQLTQPPLPKPEPPEEKETPMSSTPAPNAVNRPSTGPPMTWCPTRRTAPRRRNGHTPTAAPSARS